MKKQTTPRDNFVGGNVKLTREDLDDVLEIFNTSFNIVTIEDEECTYESFEDLEKSRGKYIDQLTIVGHSPYSVFEINHSPTKRVSIMTSDIEQWDKGFNRIKAMIQKRKRFTFEPIGTLGLVAFVVLLALSITLTAQNRISLFVGVFLCIALVFISVLIVSRIYLGYHNVVTLYRRHELQNFWTRNKDKIVLAFISALIGAVLAIGAAVLLFKQGLK